MAMTVRAAISTPPMTFAFGASTSVPSRTAPMPQQRAKVRTTKLTNGRRRTTLRIAFIAGSLRMTLRRI
jgi:hypothetical protein